MLTSRLSGRHRPTAEIKPPCQPLLHCWCCRVLPQALTLRYGEPKDLQLLKELAGAASGSALGPCWLGLIDINGQLGLDKLMKAANETAAGSGRQKVELNLGQLGLLTQEQQ